MTYTRAGGSYIVARENFGPRVAQVAAAALLIDYVVTVAVQAAAGHGCGGVGDPGIGSLQPGDHGRRGALHLLREPARLTRSGMPIRAGDLLLRHHDRPDDRDRCRPRNIRGFTGIRPGAHRRSGAGPSGQRPGDGRDDPGAAACVRQRRFVADGSRGDLQYGHRFPEAAGPQRASGAHRHGLHSRVLAGRCRPTSPTSPTPPRTSLDIRRCCRRWPAVFGTGRSATSSTSSSRRRPPPSCSPVRIPASTGSRRWPASSPKTASCRDS